MNPLLLLIAICHLSFSNGLVLKNDNIVNSGIYIPKSKIGTPKYSFIESEIMDLNFNKEYLMYFDLNIQNTGVLQNFNIFTFGNDTDDISLTFFINPTSTSFGIGIGLYRNGNNAIIYNAGSGFKANSIQRCQIILGSKNNTMFLSINNLILQNYIYPNYPSNIFNIRDGKIKISNKLLNGFNNEMIYNKMVFYNRSLVDDEIDNLFMDKIETQDVFLYYNFNQGSIMSNAISNLHLNQSEGLHFVNTTINDFRFYSGSIFKKMNFGSVPVIFTLNTLRDINATINIDSQDFRCKNIYRNVSKEKPEYIFVNLFSCEILLKNVGQHNIYLSVDNSQSYFLLNEKFTITQYTINDDANIQVVQSSILPVINNIPNDFLLMSIIGSCVAVCILLLLLLLMKCGKSETIANRLIKLDLLHITLKNKNISEIKENSRDGYIGRGNTFYIRSSIVGGVLTIFLVIISIFISYSYINNALNNNTEITIYLSRSDFNTVMLEKSFINSTVIFYNLFYSNC